MTIWIFPSKNADISKINDVTEYTMIAKESIILCNFIIQVSSFFQHKWKTCFSKFPMFPAFPEFPAAIRPRPNFIHPKFSWISLIRNFRGFYWSKNVVDFNFNDPIFSHSLLIRNFLGFYSSKIFGNFIESKFSPILLI